MKSSTGYMTSAVLVGLLDHEPDCCPNLINVLNFAKESGVTVQYPLILENTTQQQQVCVS